jgi:hypothetical protein
MANVTPIGKSFQRLTAFPIDSMASFESLLEAQDYVDNSAYYDPEHGSTASYPGQVISVKEADGKFYLYVIDGDGTTLTLSKVGGGATTIDAYSFIMQYNFSAADDESLVNGQIQLNDVDPELATKLWISNLSTTTLNMNGIIHMIEGGNRLRLQDKAAPENYILYKVTNTPIDFKTGYAEIEVEYIEHGGTLTEVGILVAILPPVGGATGDLDTDHVVLAEDFKINAAAGTKVGALSGSSETIPAGTTLTQWLTMISKERVAPTYLRPTLSLTGSGDKQVEVGAEMNITLDSIFTQRDGGTVDAFSLKENGTEISTTIPIPGDAVPQFAMPEGTKTYQASAGYLEGAPKPDNFGVYDANGIASPPEPRVVSSNVVYTGVRKLFYGFDGTRVVPTTSAEVRGLNGTPIMNPKAGTVFNIVAPEGQNRFVFAYPKAVQPVTEIFYVTFPDNYTELFVETEVLVEGANGDTAVPYRVYTYEFGVTSGSPMEFRVTI